MTAGDVLSEFKILIENQGFVHRSADRSPAGSARSADIEKAGVIFGYCNDRGDISRDVAVEDSEFGLRHSLDEVLARIGVESSGTDADFLTAATHLDGIRAALKNRNFRPKALDTLARRLQIYRQWASERKTQ